MQVTLKLTPTLFPLGHEVRSHFTPAPPRYGCDQAYNDRSNRAQHEKRAHGVLGVRAKDGPTIRPEATF